MAKAEQGKATGRGRHLKRQCDATRVTCVEGVTQQARRKTKGWARGVMYTGEKGGVSK